jgi:prepilin-type N-terminal cleavage/methylation domain-containing protein
VIISHRRSAGFTLIELMIVVTIIGILASLAIPAFSQAVRRTKSAEAVMNLRRVYDGAVTSFLEIQVTRDGIGQDSHFPAAVGATPGVDFCCTEGVSGRCPADDSTFTLPTWQRLQFSVSDPHYYWYTFASEGTGVAAHFTARASGNLDCDNIHSTFERQGYVDLIDGSIKGGAGIFKNQPLE